jgi:hypothetical protein
VVRLRILEDVEEKRYEVLFFCVFVHECVFDRFKKKNIEDERV